MKKIFTSFLFCTLLMIQARSQSVVISQVYGAGGNAGSVYQNDFVELFNASSSAVDIGGWSIQYSNATNATGSWGVTVLPSFTLNPGQYFLIQLAAGANGIALPTADATGTTNMGSAGGRLALVNNSTQLTPGCPASSSAYVDLVGFGNATCFEGSGPTPAPSTANAIFRGNNGCTDVQNNATDFTAAPPAPRNSASPVNLCGAPVAYISTTPGSITFNSNTGTASAIQSYTLQAANLTPAAGNITVTPSANIEISLNGAGPFVTTALTVPYTGGSLAATPVYIRVLSSAPQGALAATLTNSGGTAPNAVVNISGAVFQNFYNTKANLGLHTLGSWSSTLNGSGASPASFTADYQLFNIVNAANTDYTGTFNVSNAGNTTRLIVGDGVNPVTFMVKPNADSVTSATRVDVLNNGTLDIDNRRRPFLNTIADGSTVIYSLTQIAGPTDTIRITNSVQYYNLILRSGIKFLPTGTTTIRGNFTVDGVASFGGAFTSVSKANVFGNVSFINGAAFDAGANADAAKISIGFNGSTGAQALNGTGIDLQLFRIQRDSTTSPSVITVSPNTTLTLGAATGGGLLLNQSGANTTVLSTGANTINFVSGGSMSTSSTGALSTAAGTVNVLRTIGTGDGGLLRFTSGSTLASLVVNLGTDITRDTLTIADSVIVQNLTLTKGKVVVRPTAALEVANGGTITGGSANSFVDGKLKRSSTQSLLYPVGKGKKYAPVTITQSDMNIYTIQYFNTGYSNLTIDPATKAVAPNYYVSPFEYWQISRENTSSVPVNLTFSYDTASHINDPALTRMALFYDGDDWNDLGTGTLEPGSTPSSGKITLTGINVFNLFTFSAELGGVIPIRLEYVNGQKQNNANIINWKITCLSTRVTMEVLRSADGSHFNTIQTIEASQERCNQPFAYTDASPFTGKSYYRIKMIDVDGKISYSPIIAVLNGGRGFEFVGVFPTYTNNETKLSVSSVKAVSVETRITDMSGRLVQSFKSAVPAGSSLIKIDCGKLAPGMYTITSVADKTTSAALRFVKY
ncbi:MAG: lamin tail domain-containing protein [Ferruginibacter sp.]